MTVRNIQPARGKTSSSKKDPRIIALNVVIVILILVVGYLSYALIARHVIHPPVVAHRPESDEIIQLDVLNGCGIDGVASEVTGYLRARGFDVVEIRNYKSFDVDESLVIDRVGNLKSAERVAYALGIKKENVIQQLNQDYYVDVSVVVGKDIHSLKPSH